MNATWYKRFNPAGNLLTDSNNLYPGYQAHRHVLGISSGRFGLFGLNKLPFHSGSYIV